MMVRLRTNENFYKAPFVLLNLCGGGVNIWDVTGRC